MSEHYIPWILGLAFSVLIGHLAISPTMKVMWRAVRLDRESSRYRLHSWQPAAQGLVERALFTVAISTGFAAFVAAWLVLKTASRWSSFIGGGEHEEELNRHAIHVNYVLGTGLSISFAGAGAFIITLLEAEKATPALLVGAGTVVATVCLGEWVAVKAKTSGYLKKPKGYFK